MKIIVVCIFSLFFFNLSIAQVENNPIQQVVDSFCKSSGLENAAISFMAFDLDSNQVLASFNSRLTIPSASTTKLFTTATAFEVLGKEYRPKTEVYYSGKIDSLGVLHGDIVIRGLGDPSLGSRYFYEKEKIDSFLVKWIGLISKKGITQIGGKILADGSAFGYKGAPDGWSWSDMGNYYGTGPSACAVYDNTTFLHFSTSNQINGYTFLDSMTPPIPNLQIDNKVKTFNAYYDNAYIYGTPFSYHRFAIGNLPRNKDNFEVKVSVPDPELLLAQTLENALNKANIKVSFPAVGLRTILQETDTIINYKKLKLLFVDEGKTVQEIAYWTNLRSVNFFAEQLLSLVGYEKTGLGETKNGVEYSNKYWENRLNVKMYQTDGSGLSRSNGFSANHFIQLLKYMYKSKSFKDYESTLAVAGESGTMRGICRGQLGQGRIKAKSGTMNKIKSYAGYVDSKSGRKIAFAIIVNNYDYSNAQLVKEMETIFNAMAGY